MTDPGIFAIWERKGECGMKRSKQETAVRHKVKDSAQSSNTAPGAHGIQGKAPLSGAECHHKCQQERQGRLHRRLMTFHCCLTASLS